MKKVAFITGATSGIGAATARAFAEEGYNLVLTGRRAERLKEIKKELKDKYEDIKIQVIGLDVRDKRSVEAAISSLYDTFRHIDVLVNNAGIASDMVRIQDGDLSNWDQVIDTNVKGILYVTRSIAEMMIKRGEGHIVNIGSIAGTDVYEMGNVYCASKHAVHALSTAMRIDMLGTGVRVTEIRPGRLDTEFSLVRYHGDAEAAAKVYEGYQPLYPEDVAEAIVWSVNQPEHVNIDEIVMTPKAQANSYYLKRES